MNSDLELEKKIIYLVNEFNSNNYNLVINQIKQLTGNKYNIPIIYNLLGASFSNINNDAEAIVAFKNALKIDSQNEEIIRNLAKSYNKLGEDKKAYECFNRAIKINPNNADAIFGIGLLELKKNNFQESITKFSLAIKYNKNLFQAYYNKGIAYNYLGNLFEAQKNYFEAININKSYHQAYNNLGSILIKIKKTNDAIKILEKAIEIKPNYIEALTNIGVAYLDLKKFESSLEYFDKVLSIDPFYVKAISQKLYVKRKICDWGEEEFTNKNLNLIKNSKIAVTPWQLLSLDDDPKVEFIRAKKYGDQFSFQDFKSIHKNSKIKLAYFSSDFYEHAGMINMEGIFKYHDKNKFEIFAYDYGYFHNDTTHKRIKKYFDHFVYINELSDDEVCNIIKKNKIDIVIHRNGYSQNSRNTIFAKKIAPLQISFLGYPGTMGVKFIDYIIADKTVIPEVNKKYFSENIIYMPDTYYPTNNERKVSKKNFSKKELEIDNDTFVFGSLNNSYKITSKEFSIWMKLLEKIKNSNLILQVGDETTKNNLRKEIKKFNQDPNRVKFLDFINNEEHLARHQLIDLYLDTFNYNGHTSAVDALYTGTPIITKIGNSFTARVCASILNALNMPELIVNNEDEYFNLAFEIATNKKMYKKIKQLLMHNNKTYPLFNTKEYVRNLEKGYQIAYENKIKQNKIQDILI